MDGSKSQIIIQSFPRWLSKELAATYTTFSKKQIERFISAGLLPYTRVNGSGHIRIDRNDLDRLMEFHKVNLQKSKGEVLKKLSPHGSGLP